MHTARWLRQPERGNRRTAYGLIWLALRLGRPVVQVLVFPACFYYFCVAGSARRAIRRFLSRALRRPVSVTTVLQQFINFGTTIIDRIYILRGTEQAFDVQINGAASVQSALTAGRGCILLGSHLGSFEIARASAVVPAGTALKILMHEVNAQLARELTAYLNPEAAAAVIAAGTPETMLKVKECLEQGGMVGMLGDRVLDEQRAITCEFLGKPALFPDSPLRLAAALDVPIVLFFGLYRGGNKYELYFEPLADRIRLTSDRRSSELQAWLQRYVQRLEYYCRMAPDNWFNFFDFWCEEP